MADRYVYQNENEADQFNHHSNQSGFIKRTVEKVLTWIGIILHLIWAIIGTVGISLLPQLANNDEIREALNEQGKNADELANQSVSVGSLIIPFGIPLVLAIIAVFLFKKRILAGILLVIAALTGLFLSGSLIAAILWLIAGIMLFARKPKNNINPNYNTAQHEHINSDRHNEHFDQSKVNDLKSDVSEKRVNDLETKDSYEDKAKNKFDDFKNK